MKKALLLVDLSKDFVYLDGALNCGQAGMDIIPYCENLVREFLTAGYPVFDARDLHDMEDNEIASGLFPPHNMRGTDGQELISELATILNDYRSLWLPVYKKNYDAGFRTELHGLLQKQGIQEIHVIGVCTDICVRYTVSGLYAFKTSQYPELSIVVHSRGVASFNPNGHEESLRHFPIAFGAKVL